MLLKYEILFDGVFENILASPCILNCYQRLALFAESYTQYLKCTWQLSKKGIRSPNTDWSTSPVKDTEWIVPTFLTHKKDDTVRRASDLRELNVPCQLLQMF